MNCPKCGAGNCRYLERRKGFQKTAEKKFQRTDFRAKCKECGWEGVL